MGDLRYTRKMRAIRGRYKADRPQPCMRCGQPIDYDAPPDDPNAFNLGHIKSYSSHPELRQDPGNLQQEHAGCNKSAGARDGTSYTLGQTSRDW